VLSGRCAEGSRSKKTTGNEGANQLKIEDIELIHNQIGIILENSDFSNHMMPPTFRLRGQEQAKEVVCQTYHTATEATRPLAEGLDASGHEADGLLLVQAGNSPRERATSC